MYIGLKRNIEHCIVILTENDIVLKKSLRSTRNLELKLLPLECIRNKKTWIIVEENIKD